VQGHYKCRGNFVVGLRATLRRLIMDAIGLDREIVAKIEEFCHREFDFTRRTTPGEIIYLNEVIDVVIEDLERLGR